VANLEALGGARAAGLAGDGGGRGGLLKISWSAPPERVSSGRGRHGSGKFAHLLIERWLDLAPARQEDPLSQPPAQGGATQVASLDALGGTRAADLLAIRAENWLGSGRSLAF
jgi:hypothetical protein